MQIHINCHIIIIQPNVLMIISLKHLEISYNINDLTQLLDQLIWEQQPQNSWTCDLINNLIKQTYSEKSLNYSEILKHYNIIYSI